MSTPGLPTKFDNTFGAALIGGFVTAVFYGISAAQTFIYFQHAKAEDVFMRASIWLLWLLTTLQLVCICHALYWFMVTNFTNVLVLAENAPWSFPMIVFFTAATDVIAQGWLIFRVWRLSKSNYFLCVPLALLSVAVFVTSLATTIRFFKLQSFPKYQDANWEMYLGLVLLIVTDGAIAAALFYFLRRMRSSTIRRTHSMINALMVYTVNTGVLPSLVCAACLVTRAIEPNNFVYIALYFPLGSMYSNALLGSLNARDWFRGKRDAHLTIPLGSLGGVQAPGTPRTPSGGRHSKDDEWPGPQTSLSVQVVTEVVKAEL